MKSLSSILLLSSIIFLQGCRNRINNESDEHKTIYISESIGQEFDFSTFIAEYSIIQLEKNEQCLLNTITKVFYKSGVLYIYDATDDNVFIFKESGEFIKQLSTIGKGPGEYIDITDIAMDKSGKQLALLSIEKKSVYFYSSTGDFIKSLTLPFQATKFAFINDKTLAFYIPLFDEQNKSLYITDLQGNILHTGFDFPKGTLSFDMTNVTGNILGNKSAVLFSEPTSSKIYQINSDGNTALKYAFEFGKSAWPEEDKYNLPDFFTSLNRGEVSFLGNEYYESDDVIAFSYNLKFSKDIQSLKKRKGFSFLNEEMHFTEYNFRSDPLFSLLKGPKGITEKDQFIYFIYPHELEQGNRSNINNPIIQDLLASSASDEDANPILFIFNFKKP